MTVDDEQTVKMFKALGDPTRLKIVRFLQCCPQCGTFDEQGQSRSVTETTVGDVCCSVLGSPDASSKLSFHLKELRQAGLIHMQRKGKFIVCSLVDGALQRLVEHLSVSESENVPDCCTSEPDSLR